MSCQILLSWSDISTLFGHSCQIFSLNCRSLIYAEFLKKICTLDANSRRAVVCVQWQFDANSRRAVVNVLRALDFSLESGCDQIIYNSTHTSGNCLDLIFTDTPGVVAGNVGSPIGTSDHCYVSAIIKAEHAVPDISFSHKIYLISQADWDGILNNLHELDWPDIYRQVDFVASMNDAFEWIIARQIPSPAIQFLIKDKAWFNDDCKWVILAKQEAYQLWRKNCSDIT